MPIINSCRTQIFLLRSALDEREDSAYIQENNREVRPSVVLESTPSAECPLDHHQRDPTSASIHTSPPSAPPQNGPKTTPGTAHLIRNHLTSTNPGTPPDSNQPPRRTSPERSSAPRPLRPQTWPPLSPTSMPQTPALTPQNPTSHL